MNAACDMITNGRHAATAGVSALVHSSFIIDYLSFAGET
jgi:hypothetical protein